MSLYLNTNNTVSTPPLHGDSVHIFRGSVIEPIEYDSPFSIIYLQKGKIEKRIDNRKLVLSSGDLTMISPDSRVSLSSSGEINGVFAFFSNALSLLPSNYSTDANEAHELSKVFFSILNLQKETYSKLKNYFDSLILEPELSLGDDSFGKISELIKKDIAYYFEKLPLINRKRVTTQLDILQRVENIKMGIEENCIQKFDLSAIAKTSLMSKYALIRNFKEAFNMTPNQYYISKKVDLAKGLLIKGLSVKETAMRCGYPDIFSFSKQFKMIEGYSPSKLPFELRS